MVNSGILMISDNPEEFTLKSGVKTHIYINLKNLIAIPSLLSAITQEMSNLINSEYPDLTNISFCGVPYGAIPLATNLSIIMNIPQIMVRKEGAKGYGTKKRVEGMIKGNRIILIEDVVTTGTSIKETIQLLNEEGIEVVAAFSIVNRGDRDKKYIITGDESSALGSKFIPFKYLYHIDDLVNKKIDNYFEHITNKITDKGTNIILAYDKYSQNTTYQKLMTLLEEIHLYIIGLKIHPEILQLTDEEYNTLYKFCSRNNIFLWVDRKFNDIGMTVIKQIEKYHDKADAISIAPTGGLTLDMFLQSPNLVKYILIEMSSSNNTFDLNTRNKLLSQYLTLVNSHPIVKQTSAIICQDENLIKWLNDNEIATVKPGINLNTNNDSQNQTYTSINKINHHAVMYVVGRGITESDKDKIETIKSYINKIMY